MEKFRAQEGFIHFVFANEDTYILDSMVRLNLTDYLYYELKRKHYEQICFIRGISSPYTIQLFDRRSYDFCVSQKQGLLSSLMGKEERPYQRPGQDLSCREDQIIKMIGRANKTAFVIRMDTFAVLFADHSEQLAALQRSAAHSESSLLILSSTASEKSLPLFADENGIFRGQADGKWLFPEVVRALDAENFYDRFQLQMGARCVFLNEFSRWTIRSVVRWVLWTQYDGNLQTDAEQIDRVTEYLYYYYHSDQLQSRGTSALPENKFRKYSELASALQRLWPTVCREAEQWEPEKDNTVLQDSLYVIYENEIERQLEKIVIPRTIPGFQDEEREQWYQLLRFFRTPRRNKLIAKRRSELSDCISQLDISLELGDRDTFRRVFDCLIFGLGYRFEFDERSSRIWNAYIESIQLSGAVFRLTKRIQQEQEDIADLEVEWKERMNKFRRLTGDRLTKEVEQDPMMTDEMDSILQIRDNLEHRKLILENNLSRRMVYRKNLDNIELICDQPIEMVDLDKLKMTTEEAVNRLNADWNTIYQAEERDSHEWDALMDSHRERTEAQKHAEFWSEMHRLECGETEMSETLEEEIYEPAETQLPSFFDL